jgi:hypothetical protein
LHSFLYKIYQFCQSFWKCKNAEFALTRWVHALTGENFFQKSSVQIFACSAIVTLLSASLMFSFHIVMSFSRFTFLTWSLSMGRKSICTLYVHTNDRTVPWSNCVRSSAKPSAKYKDISCSVSETCFNGMESVGGGGGYCLDLYYSGWNIWLIQMSLCLRIKPCREGWIKLHNK